MADETTSGSRAVADAAVGEGSAGDLSTLMAEAGASGVTFHFPVTIEVRETETPFDLDAIVERTLDRLVEGLDSE